MYSGDKLANAVALISTCQNIKKCVAIQVCWIFTHSRRKDCSHYLRFKKDKSFEIKRIYYLKTPH